MLLTVVLTTISAAACGDRITFAPLMTPFAIPPLPYGGSVRFDHIVVCSSGSGESIALTFDLGAVPIWVYHTGWFFTLRQQLGVHFEPAVTPERLGRVYVSTRMGVSELFYDDLTVALIPGVVVGYRWEYRDGFTAQLGAGAEVWIPVRDDYEISPWPVVELRFGKVFKARG